MTEIRVSSPVELSVGARTYVSDGGVIAVADADAVEARKHLEVIGIAVPDEEPGEEQDHGA